MPDRYSVFGLQIANKPLNAKEEIIDQLKSDLRYLMLSYNIFRMIKALVLCWV